MPHTVNYSHIEDLAKRRKAAVTDCRKYLGRRRFEKISAGLEHDLRRGLDPTRLADLLCLVGIEGYPAFAFVDHVKERMGPVQLELDLRQPVVLKAQIMPPVKI